MRSRSRTRTRRASRTRRSKFFCFLETKKGNGGGGNGGGNGSNDDEEEREAGVSSSVSVSVSSSSSSSSSFFLLPLQKQLTVITLLLLLLVVVVVVGFVAVVPIVQPVHQAQAQAQRIMSHDVDKHGVPRLTNRNRNRNNRTSNIHDGTTSLEKTKTNASSNFISEPFKELHGHDPNGNGNFRVVGTTSPDPLVSYTWDETQTNLTELQIYRVYCCCSSDSDEEEPQDRVEEEGMKPSPSPSLSSLKLIRSSSSSSFIPTTSQEDGHQETEMQLQDPSSSSSSRTYTIYDSTTIEVDWNVERAAWLEFDVTFVEGNNSQEGRNFTTTTTRDDDEGDDDDFSAGGVDDDDVWHIEAAVSEFNTPYPGKKLVPVRYDVEDDDEDNGAEEEEDDIATSTSTKKTKARSKSKSKSRYRLETNPELYEGVRFTWIYLTKTKNTEKAKKADDTTMMNMTTKYLIVSNITLVAKIKPVSYRASFDSPSIGLNRIWYTGAYSACLNIEQDQFNSILIERGDRVAIQGDAHPTIATALTVFSGGGRGYGGGGYGRSNDDDYEDRSDEIYNLVWKQLLATNSGSVHGHHVVDDTIMAYPLYWIGSVLDWYWTTGDHRKFQTLIPDVLSIIDARIDDFLSKNLDIGWMGWDDRLGNGWCFHYNHDKCPYEAHMTFAGLVLKVVRDISDALAQVNDQHYYKELSEKYKSIHHKLAKRFRLTVIGYPRSLGVHAAANAIMAEIASQADIDLWMNSTLNDLTTICSWSSFNQYWILQSYGVSGEIEKAIESIHHCWGNMIELGKGCFFELSSPDWPSFRNDGDRLPTMPSLCHPWASGVTPWMSKHVVGIQPLKPGYPSFMVSPFVSKTYPHIAGTVPTPYGSISVNATWSEQQLGFESQVTVTINVTTTIMTLQTNTARSGYVGVYRNTRSNDGSDCKLKNVLNENINGTRLIVWSASREDQNGTHLQQDRRILLSNIPPHFSRRKRWIMLPMSSDLTINNNASFSASYICDSTTDHDDDDNDVGIQPFHRSLYPANVSIDRNSRGDGLHLHGSDGYVLLGADPDDDDGSGDITKLPSYIKSIKIYNHGFYGSQHINSSFVGFADNSDKTFLPYNSTTRVLGTLGADDDTYWNPGIVVDVNMTSPSSSSSSSPTTSTTRQRQTLQDKYDQGILVDVMTSSNSTTDLKKPGGGGGEDSLRRHDDESTTTDTTTTTTYYKLSVYCVSLDSNSNHQQQHVPSSSFAIRVMDLHSLNVIGPTKLIDDYGNGVWWTVEYNSSLRLRIMGIYGMHISAVAFSSSSSSSSSSPSSPSPSSSSTTHHHPPTSTTTEEVMSKA